MIDDRRHITIDSIRDAAAALGAMRGGAVRTPLVHVELPARAGAPRDLDLYLKLEIFQPIGAFKIRARSTSSGSSRAISWPAASGPSAPATRPSVSRTPRGGLARAVR